MANANKHYRTRKCKDCGHPVVLKQGYYFNFITGEVRHKRCPHQAQG